MRIHILCSDGPGKTQIHNGLPSPLVGCQMSLCTDLCFLQSRSLDLLKLSLRHWPQFCHVTAPVVSQLLFETSVRHGAASSKIRAALISVINPTLITMNTTLSISLHFERMLLSALVWLEVSQKSLFNRCDVPIFVSHVRPKKKKSSL